MVTSTCFHERVNVNITARGTGKLRNGTMLVYLDDTELEIVECDECGKEVPFQEINQWDWENIEYKK